MPEIQLAVSLEKAQWDDIADLIDAGFELMEGADEAYLETVARSWSRLRAQLEGQGYDWDPRARTR